VASAITSSILTLDSTRAARLVNVSFRGNTTVGATTNNLVYITDSITSARSITFEMCSFSYAGSGVNIVVQGSGISAVRIDNCAFDYLSNVGYFVSNTVNGITTLNNYYGNVTTIRSLGINGNLTSLGGSFINSTPAGLILGKQQVGTTNIVSIPAGNAVNLTQLSVGAGSFDYQLDDGTNFRFGTFKYTNTGSAITFEDDYTETGSVLNANLFANATGNLSCSVSSTATIKYNLKQYIS